jgi:hexokinase
MYLGDCVRRVLVRMAQEAGIFGPFVPHKLLEPFSLQYVLQNSVHVFLSCVYFLEVHDMLRLLYGCHLG